MPDTTNHFARFVYPACGALVGACVALVINFASTQTVSPSSETFDRIYPSDVGVSYDVVIDGVAHGFPRPAFATFHVGNAQFVEIYRTGACVDIGILTLSAILGAALAWMLLPRTLGTRRAELRAGSDRCEGCGYSLRGNVSGVCPECGAPTRSLIRNE